MRLVGSWAVGGYGFMSHNLCQGLYLGKCRMSNIFQRGAIHRLGSSCSQVGSEVQSSKMSLQARRVSKHDDQTDHHNSSGQPGSAKEVSDLSQWSSQITSEDFHHIPGTLRARNWESGGRIRPLHNLARGDTILKICKPSKHNPAAIRVADCTNGSDHMVVGF